MQIVIPMSGTGQRFLDAGYTVPKPLIEIDGKTVIEHVVNLFRGESDFIFICNAKDLKETVLRERLGLIARRGRIIEIEPHKKGPVYAVSKAFDIIKDDEETIVNYCDFSKHWDYHDFLKHTRTRGADGAISAYRGFHPHMLGDNNYAFMRDERQWMVEIREKSPFTGNKMQEYASDGTYYFRNGAYVKKYFKRLLDEDIRVNGEYYVSMVYNLMKEDGLKISIYEIQHMLQWGAPEDLEEYKRWSTYFTDSIKSFDNIRPKKNNINLIPLAGAGNRFIKSGYKEPKPLICVSGKPMIIQAAKYLPRSEKHVFVCLGEHLDNHPLEKEIRKLYPDARIVRIDRMTEGQACTCERGLGPEDLKSPLLIAACDNGMLWDRDRYQGLVADNDIDAVVWGFRHHPSAAKNPCMYGWIKADDRGNVSGVSVKVPISDRPYDDYAIVGTFYFKEARYFIEALKGMYERDSRVNGEFYVDSCINELVEAGLRVKVFEVSDYICWGTPDDLRTYEYWQSFFHKCDWHPYRLEKDAMVDKDKIAVLDNKYRTFKQQY